jgi:hypothetical protein
VESKGPCSNVALRKTPFDVARGAVIVLAARVSFITAMILSAPILRKSVVFKTGHPSVADWWNTSQLDR